jgi:hypothetical protein
VVENVADVLISSIPFYFILKIAFLYWCFSPQFRGANFIYQYVIKAHIVPHILGKEGDKAKEPKAGEALAPEETKKNL